MGLSAKAAAILQYVAANASPDDGVTQKQIIESTGISQQTVSRVLNLTPGFIRTPRPIHMQGWSFDPSLFPQSFADSQSLRQDRQTEAQTQAPVGECDRPHSGKLFLESLRYADGLKHDFNKREVLVDYIVKEVLPKLSHFKQDTILTQKYYDEVVREVYSLGIQLESFGRNNPIKNPDDELHGVGIAP